MAAAQVPALIHYHGRVVVGATNFNGTDQFKFALVDGAGATHFWSNDGTRATGSEPVAAVSLGDLKFICQVNPPTAFKINWIALPP